MANDHIKSDISLYLTGSLSESRRRDVDAHLASCEKCRHAVSKARSKQARINREVLKKASPDRVPNLLLTRLGKEAGFDRRPPRLPWGWIGLSLLAVVIIFAVSRHESRRSAGTTGSPGSKPAVSTSTVQQVSPALDVAPSSVAAAALSVPKSAPRSEPVSGENAQQWAGAESAIKESRKVVLRGRSAWRALWVEMGHSEESAPRVNFNEWIIIGVFVGEVTRSTQIILSTPKEEDDHIVVTYRLAPNPSVSSGSTAHPYLLKTIPQSSKPVRLIPIS
ncbi:MAG: zf-HC2 domain-containing protein [Elusimicrobiota bacterium]|jgi:hypothetical protein